LVDDGAGGCAEYPDFTWDEVNQNFVVGPNTLPLGANFNWVVGPNNTLIENDNRVFGDDNSLAAFSTTLAGRFNTLSTLGAPFSGGDVFGSFNSLQIGSGVGAGGATSVYGQSNSVQSDGGGTMTASWALYGSN